MTEEAIQAHIEKSEDFQETQVNFNAEMALFKAETEGSLASIHERMGVLATKEDIKEVLIMMKNINIGFGFLRFSWNNAGKIGAFILLIGGIFVFFKVGLLGIIAFFSGK